MKVLFTKNDIIKLSAILLLIICLFYMSGALFRGIEAMQMTITPSSVTLYWTAPGDDGGTGTANQYDIRYSTSMITEENWSSATQATGEPTPGTAGTSEQFDVTDLVANTTYYFAIRTCDESGNWSAMSNIETATTLDLSTDVDVPDNYELSQNYPNPFNAATRIDYYVPAPGHVTLSVHDILGRTVSTIVDEVKNVGEYDVLWNGLDGGGRPVASGLYFYRLRAGDKSYSRKMMLLK